MKLSKQTIEKLQLLSNISNSIAIEPGSKLSTKKIGNSVVAYFDIEDTIESSMYIYDLREFLSLLALLENPEIDLSNEKIIQLAGDYQTVKYYQAEEFMVKDSKAPANIKFGEPDISFSLNIDSLTKLNKAFSLFMSDQAQFIGSEDGIYAVLASDSSSSTSNEYKIKVSDTPSEEFKAVILKENLKFLKRDTYTVELNKAGICKFYSTDCVIYIVLEQNSQFN